MINELLGITFIALYLKFNKNVIFFLQSVLVIEILFNNDLKLFRDFLYLSMLICINNGELLDHPGCKAWKKMKSKLENFHELMNLSVVKCFFEKKINYRLPIEFLLFIGFQ